MATSGMRSRRERGKRHGIVAALLGLLPLLSILGVLAPSFIQAQNEEKEDLAVFRGPVTFRPIRLSRRPLLVPRDYSPGFVPELLDLEQLFTGRKYRKDTGFRISRLPTFNPHRGDVIVFDDVDTVIADEVFEDVLRPSMIASADLDFDELPPLMPLGNGIYYDDLMGGSNPPVEFFGPPVPEPGTGVLLGLGLVVLGIRRRRG
jgi:hypothetical protein